MKVYKIIILTKYLFNSSCGNGKLFGDYLENI